MCRGIRGTFRCQGRLKLSNSCLERRGSGLRAQHIADSGFTMHILGYSHASFKLGDAILQFVHLACEETSELEDW